MSMSSPWIWMPLAGGSAAKIDLADWPTVEPYRWFCAAGGRGVCAAVSPKPKRRYVMLHRLVAGVTDPKTVVRPRNGDIYDCRRENLEVISRAQVNAEAKHTPPGAEHVGGWTWRTVRRCRGGRAYRYALVTYRRRRIYCKTEAEAVLKLQWLRVKDALGPKGRSTGVIDDEPSIRDYEGLAQCSHVFVGRDAA